MATTLNTLKFPSATVENFGVYTISSYTWDKNTQAFFLFLNGITLQLYIYPHTGFDDGYRLGTPQKFSEVAFNENLTSLEVKITDSEDNILIDWTDWNDIADDVVEFPSDYFGTFHVSFRVYFQDQNGDGSLEWSIANDFEAISVRFSSTKEIITIEPINGSFTIGDTQPIYDFLISNSFRVVYDDDSEEEVPVITLLGGQFTFEYVDTNEQSQTLTYTYPYESYKMPSSAKVRTLDVNGKLSPQITFKYSLNGVETTKVFTIIDFYVNGIVSLYFNRLVNVNLGNNYLDGTHIKTSQLLDRPNLEIFGTDGFGNTSLLDENNYIFSGEHYSITTQATAGIEQFTIIKEKMIKAADGSLDTYVFDSSISHTFELKVVDMSQVSLYVEPLKTTYRQGDSVTKNDFDAYLRYYVDGTLDNDYLVFDNDNVTYLPITLENVGSITITINDSSQSLSTTYIVLVLGDTDKLQVVSKTPTITSITKTFRKTNMFASGTISDFIKLEKNERLKGIELHIIGETITYNVKSIDEVGGSYVVEYSSPLGLRKVIRVTATIDRYLYEIRDYGEVEIGYNMNFVLDGSRDTTQVRVFNFEREELKPNTIVYMGSTNSWWIVKKDISRRYAHEIGGQYEHTISLEQMIEILGARDNQNTGYNIDHYTLKQMLDKMAYVCDFELPISFSLYPYADENQNINYLKTFENYTPLSAFKEIFRGLNLEPKASGELIEVSSKLYLSGMSIYAIPKSGLNTQEIDISYFDSEEETLQSDKASYGTRVVSNVQNCVSADEIVYPIQGSMRLTSHTNSIKATTDDDAVLRLPSNVYKVNKLVLARSVEVNFIMGSFGTITISGLRYRDLSYSEFREKVLEIFDKNYPVHPSWYDGFITALENHMEEIFDTVNDVSTITFNNGGSYNSLNNTYTNAVSLKYLQQDGLIFSNVNHSIYLNSIEYSELPPEKFHAIYWEQGKNEIKNFTFLTKDVDCIGQEKSNLRKIKPIFSNIDINAQYYVDYDYDEPALTARRSTFVVFYVPMSDMKLKVDNDLVHNDTKLYNQNSKLVDSYAVSKLVNSHAVEVSSSEITRQKIFYNYFNIPQVGQIVLHDGERYIINNISLDVLPNDDSGFYINGVFNMTKAIACKSTMINANTNIRDYDIPQKNNVERTTCFKDYIEFKPLKEEIEDYHTETPFNSLSHIFSFGTTTYGDTNVHEAVIKVQGKSLEPYSPSTNGAYAYHIGCVRYNLNKQYIEMIDFKDNNIIGYEAGVSLYVFQVATIFQRKDSTSNTPISYVDDTGELDSINIRLCNGLQLETAYTESATENSQNTDYIYAFNKFVSLPYSVYDKIDKKLYYDIALNDNQYKKDGLEVPKFEYICQVGDSNGVVFGANFLKSMTCGENERYAYYFHTINGKVNVSQDNVSLYMDQTNRTSISYSYPFLVCLNTDSVDVANKTIVFYRATIDTTTNTIKHKEFLFSYYHSIRTELFGIFGVENWKIK